MKVLVTFPGKLGDLVYTLPAVRALGEQLPGTVSYETSPYCRSARPLLCAQPYLEDCLLDEAYVLAHTRFGCQPYELAEPPGFDRVFHLGLRPDLAPAEVFGRHLMEVPFLILEREYGLGLEPDLEGEYLFLDEVPSGEEIVFQGYGQALMDNLPLPVHEYLQGFWRDLLGLLGRKVLVVTGPEALDYYAWLDAEILVPESLLETARIIKAARMFVGVQSVAAALANGLKVPRLIFNWFPNASPTGPGGMSFSVPARPQEVFSQLKTALAL